MFIIRLSFFFSSRRRHTTSLRDWSSDVCSSDLLRWREGLPGLFVRYQFNAANKPEPARLAYQRMIVERGEARLELRRTLRGALEYPIARINFDCFERDCGGNGMAAISKAMTEGADLFTFRKQRLIHDLRNHDARDRRVGRRQRLGHRNRVRCEFELLATKGGAEPAEAANPLAAPGKHTVLAEDHHDLLEIALRRQHQAAG